ncbi:hypothetical protein F3Y22_tig00110505pilonHSYRG00328 [Hibiscus syriacus]|uniref:Reverse transcriptase domain-containing protein n=1 Tax=Hibiscus syriacus TaxID=106335 RepID=A0A6A3ABG1_HIBSY|nr:hypothetical protein F3Y22_tig00110505pilonHSYRG00328 [Hibiscus syriacus]
MSGEVVVDWRKLFAEGNEQELIFFPPSEVEGSIVVKPPQSMFEEGISEWRYALVGQFIGLAPNFGSLQKIIELMWGKSSPVKVSLAGSNLFVFSFVNSIARDWALKNCPWHVQHTPIFIRKWEPNLKDYIASALGRPLHMDSITTTRERLEYAHICIEVFAGKYCPQGKKVEQVWRVKGVVKEVNLGAPASGCEVVQDVLSNEYVSTIVVDVSAVVVCSGGDVGCSGGVAGHDFVEVVTSNPEQGSFFGGKDVWIIAVYGSNKGCARRKLWHQLRSVESVVDILPWLIGGDFNVNLNSAESSVPVGVGVNADIHDFQSCVEDLCLFDHLFTHPLFTWLNKQQVSYLAHKLDRVLVNSNWIGAFPDSVVEFQALGDLDHCPALVWLHKEALVARPKPFKFFNFWMLHLEFMFVVEESWQAPTIDIAGSSIDVELQVQCDLKILEDTELFFYKQKKTCKVVMLEDILRYSLPMGVVDALCMDISDTAIRLCFADSSIISTFNATTVVLMPKVPNPSMVKDFRPISCCSVIYKTVTRILVSRLSIVFPGMISMNQTAFVKGRSIVDNTLLAQEIVWGYARNNISPRRALKIDLQKAFDSLNWEFVGVILLALGLPEKFIGWIWFALQIPGSDLKTWPIWEDLRVKVPKVPWHSLVWFPGRIPKHNIIVWMVILNRLPTQVRLLRMRLSIENDKCVFCGAEAKTRDNLVFDCGFVRELWGDILTLCGVTRRVSCWDRELAWAVHCFKGKYLYVRVFSLL